ncbi:MAG: T9SS type A sorting domain-containing protein [Bacteroidales bacterium]|nr:T9SS type A sorting domain-containing protein [Bacteroidales bacterium]
MKKFLSTALVAMLTMVSMTFAQSTSIESSYFIITNTATNDVKTIALNEFSKLDDNLYSRYMSFEKGVYNGEKIEITYKSVLSWFTPYLTWYGGWPTDLKSKGTGLTKIFTIENVPSFGGNTYVVKCNYKVNAQSSKSEDYLINFLNVHAENRITIKSSNASEVQVSYADYEEMASAGQRASTALYDIYGNLVSTGYLDGFGKSTLSTRKPGLYIVKVIMNNQVIFNQRIQVK